MSPIGRVESRDVVEAARAPSRAAAETPRDTSAPTSPTARRTCGRESPCVVATNAGRPVTSRANLSAPSTASAPLLARNTCGRCGGSTLRRALRQTLRARRCRDSWDRASASPPVARWPRSRADGSGRASPRLGRTTGRDSVGRAVDQPAAFAAHEHRVAAARRRPAETRSSMAAGRVGSCYAGPIRCVSPPGQRARDRLARRGHPRRSPSRRLRRSLQPHPSPSSSSAPRQTP